MRVVFMGTPEIARTCLQRLADDGKQLVGVFTKPDTPQKRGLKLTASPVKKLAQELGVPVFQPQTLRDGGAEQTLRDLAPDVIAVVAYGKLLPQQILDLPPLGCVNIHASLLPLLRGAAPVQRAVLEGFAETGVTAMYMAAAMDAGDIIAQTKTAIGPDETAGELMDRLAELGAELLTGTLDRIAAGTAARTPQQDELATLAPMLNREEAPIDWGMTAQQVHNRIRGLNPWPMAETELAGTRLRLLSSKVLDETSDKAPGTPLSAGKQGLDMACGGGSVLRVTRLQAQGGKPMAAADYFRGHRLVLS